MKKVVENVENWQINCPKSKKVCGENFRERFFSQKHTWWLLKKGIFVKENSSGLNFVKFLTKQANTEIPCTHMTPEREEYI